MATLPSYFTLLRTESEIKWSIYWFWRHWSMVILHDRYLLSLFGLHTLIMEFLGRLVGNCMFEDIVWCLTGSTDLILVPITAISRDIFITDILILLVILILLITAPASWAASPPRPPFLALLINHTAAGMMIDKWSDQGHNSHLNCLHWSKYVLWQQVSLQHMWPASQSWCPEQRGRIGAQKLVSSSYTVLILKQWWWQPMMRPELRSPVTCEVRGTLGARVVTPGLLHPVDTLVAIAEELVAQQRTVAVIDTGPALRQSRGKVIKSWILNSWTRI